MRCQFSEFTYGFAITHEVVTILKAGLRPVSPPTLPNLVNEGSLGYDVRMDELEGWTLLWQYKLPEYLTRSTGKEWGAFGHEYYRFKTRDQSAQHELLLALEGQSVFNIVEYCTPKFATTDQLAARFNTGSLEGGTLRIRPSEIGAGEHTIAYDVRGRVVVHSDPRGFEIPSLTVDESRRLWRRDDQILPTRLTADLLFETKQRFLDSVRMVSSNTAEVLLGTLRSVTQPPSPETSDTGARFTELSHLMRVASGAQLLFIPVP